MEKAALEAMLQEDDDTLDLGPIEHHLHVLATERRLDAVALVNCTARIEESGPILRALLARAADGAPLSDEEARLAFRGLHILGGAQDQQAFQPLLRLLRRPAWEVDGLLGDVVTESLAQIVAGVFDGDAEALFAAIADRSIDEYARDSLWGAATFLTREGRIDRDPMQGFIARFYEERLAADEDYAWIGWLEAIALLGLRDLAPLVHAAWREGRVPPGGLEPLDFEQDLAATERAPGDTGRFVGAGLGYIEDVYEALLRWGSSDDDAAEAEDDAFWDDPSLDAAEPAVNPWRHVGRNDPCPCGSGKKAKKCCLAN